MTISHLRFGAAGFEAPYLIRRADFVACHQFGFLDRADVLELAAPGATLLLNAPGPTGQVWGQLTHEVQEQILRKPARYGSGNGVGQAG